jgi:Glycosyl transferases group 1
MGTKNQKSRILIFSQRNHSRNLPFRCPHFEFEDVITQIDKADLLAPRLDPVTRRHAIAKQLAYHTPIVLNPGLHQDAINGYYDLFLAICDNPTDLLRVAALRNWRKSCKTAICLIDELWATQLSSYRNFLRMLENFDLVILYYSQSVEPLSRMIKTKCVFLPPGVDAIRFCPFPNLPERVVDVYSIGRRSEMIHRALLKMTVDENAFYLHDTMSPEQVSDATEHRQLFANIAKRSRYFIVNPGLIDRKDIRGEQIEIGNRYFEGAAAGTIMLGERPDNAEFDKLFNWPDPMIHVPYNSPDIGKIISSLDRDPVKLNKMRCMNVKQTLLQHDWLYRWEAILAATGLEPMPELSHRKQILLSLIESIGQAKCTPTRDASRAGATLGYPLVES